MKGTILHGLWQPQQAPFVSPSLPTFSNHFKSCVQVRKQHYSSKSSKHVCRDTQFLASSNIYSRFHRDERAWYVRKNKEKVDQSRKVLAVASDAFRESQEVRGKFTRVLFADCGKSTKNLVESRFTVSRVDENVNQYLNTSGNVDRRVLSPAAESQFSLAESKMRLDSFKSSEQSLACPVEDTSLTGGHYQMVSTSRPYEKPAEVTRTYLDAVEPMPRISLNAAHQSITTVSESISEQSVSNSKLVGDFVSRENPSVMSADHAPRSSQNGASVSATNYRGPQSNINQGHSRSVVRPIPSIMQGLYTANQRRVLQEINELHQQWRVQKFPSELHLRRSDQSAVLNGRLPRGSLTLQGAKQGNQATQLEASASRMMRPNSPLRREVQSVKVINNGKYEGPLNLNGTGQGSQVAQVQTSPQYLHRAMQASQAQLQISPPNVHVTLQVSEPQVQNSPLSLQGTMHGSQMAHVQTPPQSVVQGANRWREAAKKIEDKRRPVYGGGRIEADVLKADSSNIELEPVCCSENGIEEPEPVFELLPLEEPSEVKEADFRVALESEFSRGAEKQVVVTNEAAKLDLGAPSVEGEIQSLPDCELQWINAEVMVVNDVATAKAVVEKLRVQYKDFIHACDTEVAGIDVKKESPVGHGHMICFSIYCGPNTDFGGGRCRLWVDVLDKEEVLDVFKSYFEDPNIKKVWHNYSFDRHILHNHGIQVQGFYADTMHLARLLDSSRSQTQGGYSLEGLTSDRNLMRGYWGDLKMEEVSRGKLSMKHLFGKPNVKKNGEDGKLLVVPLVEELQTQPESRDKWIHYSCFDTVCTWCLWKSLQDKLQEEDWKIEGKFKQEGRNMYHFYEEYVQPFGKLLVQMEEEGMLLDRSHLANIEKIAVKQQEFSANQFKKWAAKRCPDAIFMNVGSDAQIRQLLFGGKENKNDPEKSLPMERTFNAPNTDNYLEEGRKVPKKTRPFTLRGLGVDIPVDSYTSAGWPAVGGASLKALAGKVAVDYTVLDEDNAEDGSFNDLGSTVLTSTGVKGGSEYDLSVYGSAFKAFGGGQEGREACMALAALCEVASINTLISNFIQPLQGSDIMGPDGRIHCSLNINTETGRLSARRPSLQNQPALEKDRYKIRQAFVAAPGKSLIVADYGQLELRILAHLTDCKSMLKAFVDGGDFHSRTAMNMYPHVQKAVENGDVILEWEARPGAEKPPVPLLKDVFAAERRKAKMLNFSIAYGKTAMGLSKDWKVSLDEAQATVELWYRDRPEVQRWQEERKREAHRTKHVHTLLGRTRHFPDVRSNRGHIERAAINTPVQGSAADVAMCAMLEINNNKILKELGWRLLLQVHDEVILEGPAESADLAKETVVKCMEFPFRGENKLRVALAVDAKYAQSWYAAK